MESVSATPSSQRHLRHLHPRRDPLLGHRHPAMRCDRGVGHSDGLPLLRHVQRRPLHDDDRAPFRLPAREPRGRARHPLRANAVRPRLGRGPPFGRRARGPGRSFPVTSARPPRVGKRFPRLRERSPRIGRRFPKRKERALTLGERFPRIGRRSPRAGKRFPRRGKGLPAPGKRFPILGRRSLTLRERLPTTRERPPDRGPRFLDFEVQSLTARARALAVTERLPKERVC
jgi:hypothetical protein